jgi:periplasmic divalent cation tolerance protein
MALVLMFTTCPDSAVASELANGALDAGLAVCILQAKVESLYDWQGKRAAEGEIVALFKTSVAKADDLEKWLVENHPYEVPAIIRIGARANESYASWLAEVLEA